VRGLPADRQQFVEILIDEKRTLPIKPYARARAKSRSCLPSRTLSLDDEWDRAPNGHDCQTKSFCQRRQHAGVERSSLTKRQGSRSASGTYFDWRCAPRKHPHQLPFPSPLEGERLGVRGLPADRSCAG
jgi:hypothetical protein